MTAVAMLPVLHIAAPGIELARAMPRSRETVASFLRRIGWSTTRTPTICVVDGEPVLRAQWRKTRIKAGMSVLFQSLPRGGQMNGASIAGLIGMIALTALAPWAGALAFGAGTIGASILSGAILLGGGFLLSTLTAVKSGGSQEAETSIYSWNRQANSAKPLQPIPCAYGRTKRVCDYAAVPWSSFEGNDQYVHLLLSEGVGRPMPSPNGPVPPGSSPRRRAAPRRSVPRRTRPIFSAARRGTPMSRRRLSSPP